MHACRSTLEDPTGDGDFLVVWESAGEDGSDEGVFGGRFQTTVVVAEGAASAGSHEAALDATALAPGVYVLRLTAAGRPLARPLTVVR